MGIEAGGQIYLKADARSAEAFRAAGSEPFGYEKNGKRITMGYWRLPDEAIDDPDAAARWGRIALARP